MENKKEKKKLVFIFLFDILRLPNSTSIASIIPESWATDFCMLYESSMRLFLFNIHLHSGSVKLMVFCCVFFNSFSGCSNLLKLIFFV